MLPIRPDGSRPAFHVVGANGTYSSADAPWEAIEQAGYLHLGAPEFMGGEEAAKILSFAREHGVVTSADILAPGEQAAAIVDWLGPAFEHLDYLLPNEEQVHRPDRRRASCRPAARTLLERGVGCVAATCGAEGALIVDRDGAERVPAFATDVVDTTGCGDAFSAGFLRGLGLERHTREAAVLGCAAAALVAQGLGSDHGDFDLDDADRFAADTHRPSRRLTREQGLDHPPAVRRRDARHRGRGGGAGGSGGQAAGASPSRSDRAPGASAAPTW